MDNYPYPPTPELDKIRAVQGDSQVIGGFLDWLYNESKYLIGEHTDYEYSCPVQESAISIEGLIAEYFEIDLKKVSDEKDSIYEYMVKKNEEETQVYSEAFPK